VVDDTEGHFAWQGIIGLAIGIDAVPGLSINAEYRYFSLLEEGYNTTAAFRAANPRVATLSTSTPGTTPS